MSAKTVEYLRVVIKPWHFTSKEGEPLADREIRLTVIVDGHEYHYTGIHRASDLESWLDLYFEQAKVAVRRGLTASLEKGGETHGEEEKGE